MSKLPPDESASAARRHKRARQRRLAARSSDVPAIDVGAPINDLAIVAESLILQMERELRSDHPLFSLRDDLAMLLRQCRETFGVLAYVNGDASRDGGAGYRLAYSAVSLPLIRTMIDIFYTVSVLIDEPERVIQYRLSGFRRKFDAFGEDMKRYGKRKNWQDYLTFQRRSLTEGLRVFGLTKVQLREAELFPTLTRYLDESPRQTKLKRTLRILMLSDWEEYSGISHASFAALLDIFPYLDERRFESLAPGRLVEKADREISMHMARAAGLLLSLLTEVQHRFKFAGGNVENRLKKIWIALKPLPVIEELYVERYEDLLP